MAHSMILGMTESGKTTCAKRIAAMVKSKGIGVIVLDPMSDPEWNADFQTDDPEKFLSVVWASRGCHVFIDEAGENVGQYDTPMIRTATKGRHWGHSVYYLSQRGTLIARTVRDQCSHLFLFTTALEDSKIHANEWNQAELKTAPQLAKGNYFHATRFGELTRGKLFGGAYDRAGTNSDRTKRDSGRVVASEESGDSSVVTDQGGNAESVTE